jgi:hypothetical protein
MNSEMRVLDLYYAICDHWNRVQSTPGFSVKIKSLENGTYKASISYCDLMANCFRGTALWELRYLIKNKSFDVLSENELTPSFIEFREGAMPTIEVEFKPCVHRFSQSRVKSYEK